MNWTEIKRFIKFHIANSRIGTIIFNAKDIHEPITKAVNDLSKTIQGKRNDIVNPESISDPIVEAQEATTEAIKGIKIPEPIPTDFTSLESKLEALLESFEKKEMVVNVGKTELDSKGIIKAIQKIKLEIPKMEKQEVIDYTMMFSEMMDIMERPKDHSEIIRLQGLVSKLGTSMDLEVIAEWLKVIAEKQYPEFPELKFNKDGRLKVEVDRAGGGGGGGLTSIETGYLASMSGATTPTIYNINLTSVDTEYSQAIPAGTKKLQFWSRNDEDIRFSFTTGKVATPTAPYLTHKGGLSTHEGELYLTGQTIYFATDVAGDVVEMLCWT
jgi:hypothetical protein